MASRRWRDPRQDKSGTYPKGFNRFGTPITCGMRTEYGECREPTRYGGKCAYHLRLSGIDVDPAPSAGRAKAKPTGDDRPKRPKFGMIDPSIQRDLVKRKNWWDPI